MVVTLIIIAILFTLSFALLLPKADNLEKKNVSLPRLRFMKVCDNESARFPKCKDYKDGFNYGSAYWVTILPTGKYAQRYLGTQKITAIAHPITKDILQINCGKYAAYLVYIDCFSKDDCTKAFGRTADKKKWMNPDYYFSSPIPVKYKAGNCGADNLCYYQSLNGVVRLSRPTQGRIKQIIKMGTLVDRYPKWQNWGVEIIRIYETSKGFDPGH